MNKERRKRLDYVIDKLEELQQEVAAIGEEEHREDGYDNEIYPVHVELGHLRGVASLVLLVRWTVH